MELQELAPASACTLVLVVFRPIAPFLFARRGELLHNMKRS